MKKHMSRIFQLLLALTLTLTSGGFVTAFAAYDVATIQVTVDDTNWEIVAGVVSESVSNNNEANGNVKEVVRIGKSALNSLAGNDGDPSVGAGLLANLNVASESEGYESDSTDKNLVLTFPGRTNTGVFSTHSSSNSHDTARANLVRDVLVYDLNAAYSLVYEGARPDSIEDYRDKMVALLKAVSSAGTVNGYFFKIATTSDISKYDDKSMLASDYVVISKPAAGRGGADVSEVFAYRIPKGYIVINNANRDFDASLDTLSTGEDAVYITWGEFAYEAFATYILDEKFGMNSSDVFAGVPGALETMIVGFVGNTINSLVGILGLVNLDELILNAGVRGGNGWIGGVFPASWETLIWTFFYIFTIIAFIVLSFAVVKGIYQKAMSTVNPIVRSSFMEYLKNMAISVFVLLLLPIIFRIMISTSATLTEIFSSALDGVSATDRFTAMATQSGTFGGLVVQLVYLAALIYFNFIYYLRSLLIAAMMILSPLFIMAYCMGSTGQGIAKEWVKVTVSTLFLQPIHAFVMMLILLLPLQGSRFQTIIAVYSLIPLTNMIRDVAFKGVGSLHVAAKNGQSSTVSHMSAIGLGAASGAIGGVIGGISGAAAGRGKSSGGGEAGGESGGSSGRDPSGATINTKEPKSSAEQTTGGEREGRAVAQDAGASEQFGGGGTYGGSNAFRGGITGGRSSVVDSDGSGAVTATASAGNPQSGNRSGKVGKLARSVRDTLGGAGMFVGGVGLSTLGGALGGEGIRTPLQKVGSGLATQGIQGIGSAWAPKVGGSASETDSTPITETPIEERMPVMAPSDAGVDGGAMGAGDANPVHSIPITPIEIGQSFGSEGFDPVAFEALPENELYESGALMKNSDSGRFSAYNDFSVPKEDPAQVENLGMRIQSQKGSPEATVSWDSASLGERDQAQMAAVQQMFEQGTPEQKQSLQASGISSFATEKKMDPTTHKETPTSYSMTVNKAKFRENYGINLTDRTATGKRAVSFPSQQVTPNVINNPKINLPIKEPDEQPPQ